MSFVVFGSIGAAAASAQTIEFGEPILFPDTNVFSLLTSADFDRDGHSDVVVGVREGAHIYFGDGQGGLLLEAIVPYYEVPPRILAADFDGDHAVDLAWIDQLPDRSLVVTFWYNGGDGRSGTLMHLTRPRSFVADIAAADVSGDGNIDLLITQNPRTIAAFINQGGRTFEFQEIYTYNRIDSIRRMAVGDVDGDGDSDIGAIFQYSYFNYHNYYDIKDTHAAILTNEGSMSFHQAAEVQLPWQTDDVIASDLSVGDIDGDGDLDIATVGWRDRGQTPNVVALLENEGSEALQIAGLHDVPGSFQGLECSLVVRDLNTNGRLDVAVAEHGDFTEGLYVLQNDGDWSFTILDPVLSDAEGSALLAVDLTSDGQLDLVQTSWEGFAMMQNITILAGPTYSHSTLVRGELAEFIVTGARPGERVHFLYSLGGSGPSRGVPALGGLTLDLSGFIAAFGEARADSEGRAALRGRIPNRAPIGPVSTQAVIRRGPGGVDSVKTPFRTARIQP